MQVAGVYYLGVDPAIVAEALVEEVIHKMLNCHRHRLLLGARLRHHLWVGLLQVLDDEVAVPNRVLAVQNHRQLRAHAKG